MAVRAMLDARPFYLSLENFSKKPFYLSLEVLLNYASSERTGLCLIAVWYQPSQQPDIITRSNSNSMINVSLLTLRFALLFYLNQ